MLLILCCGSCHAAHHRGDLLIGGTAADLRVSRPHDPGHRELCPRPTWAAPAAPATSRDIALALTGMGFSAKIANAAVAAAAAGLPPEATTDAWLRAALQACARSSA